jgi:hypothetical protein
MKSKISLAKFEKEDAKFELKDVNEDASARKASKN